MNKRLFKELNQMFKQQDSKELHLNDYLVYVDDDNINKVYSIIKAPWDSVYRHKFIRLNFDIPRNYPHSPPIVTFINADNVRIHPNMYEDGKCCSTILNTWPSDNEKWTSSMGIETIILAFQSFLDNNPYTYEPGGRDDVSYTHYVKYQSWNTCLISYLEAPPLSNALHRISQPNIFTKYIEDYLYNNYTIILEELNELLIQYPYDVYYTRCFEIDYYYINYRDVIRKLQTYYYEISSQREIERESESEIERERERECEIEPEIERETDVCNICFENKGYLTKLECGHLFHKQCLLTHLKNNGNICSLCRRVVNDSLLNNLKRKREDNDYIISPLSKRRVKIGSKTYQYLIDNDYIN